MTIPEKLTSASTWRYGSPETLQQVNQGILSNIEQHLQQQQSQKVVSLIHTWSTQDKVLLLMNLPADAAIQLMACLPATEAAAILLQANEDLRALFFSTAPDTQLCNWLNAMDDDNAAVIGLSLPVPRQHEIMEYLDAKVEIQRRQQFAEDDIGRIMDRRFVTVMAHWCVQQVVDRLRMYQEVGSPVYSVFVVDERHRLQGSISTSQLSLIDADTPLQQIMQPLVFSAAEDMDRQKVQQASDLYQLHAIPVVDEEHRVVGRITADQLRRIQRLEAEEDKKIMAGVGVNATASESIWAIVKGRLPWLITGMIGASVAALVVGGFEEQLTEVAILASFIPIVMSMAGNAGIQASAVSVQGLANGSLLQGYQWQRSGREFIGAIFNGSVAALLLTLLVFAMSLITDIDRPWMLSLAASASLVTVVTLAAVIGSSIPILLDKMKIDPAMATGVFVTTSNDVLGVSVFFIMVSHWYLG